MRKKEEKKNEGKEPSVCEQRIFAFYEWAVILAPLALMLSHWYIFYVFSQNKYELLQYSSENEICIVWIYTILYLYVPLMILPASYFFRWCTLFRVPFIYFIFINVERWYYGSWFCTNEMVDTHYILIYCIICIYIVEIVGLGIKYSKEWPQLLKRGVLWVADKIKWAFGKSKEEKEIQERMFDQMEKMLKEADKQ